MSLFHSSIPALFPGKLKPALETLGCKVEVESSDRMLCTTPDGHVIEMNHYATRIPASIAHLGFIINDGESRKKFLAKLQGLGFRETKRHTTGHEKPSIIGMLTYDGGEVGIEIATRKNHALAA